MLNKKLSSSIIFCCVLFLAKNVYAADSSIEVKARLLDNTCEVDIGSRNLTIDLLDIASKQFFIVGKESLIVPFTIDFSRCSFNTRSVKIKFIGNPDSNNSELLATASGTDMADGIGIQIMDNHYSRIPINTFQGSYIPLDASSLSNRLQYYTNMVSTKPSITPGKVRSSATFVLEFE